MDKEKFDRALVLNSRVKAYKVLISKVGSDVSKISEAEYFFKVLKEDSVEAIAFKNALIAIANERIANSQNEFENL